MSGGARARASAFVRRHPKKLAVLALLLVAPFVAHLVVALTTRIHPPELPPRTVARTTSARDPGLTFAGRSWARSRGKILEVHLRGSPVELGDAHVALLGDRMRENEGTLYAQFERHVPLAPLRLLIMDLSRVRYRTADQGMSLERRSEIAAQARSFDPDPYAGFLPTYHRMIFLNTLYDIALSFEYSPLIGCTSFALGDGAFADGHAVLARNFDFEAGPVFDEGKAVFLVREEGRIPFASVSWPGLVGVMTGMNAEGLALVVHGGRAREPQVRGEPVVHTLRAVLASARDVDEAVAFLHEHEKASPPMVSHIVMLADARGGVAVVERAPGEASVVRRGRGKVPLTNHFEGPFADDPRNQRVRDATSTLARRGRLDERLSNLPPGIDVQGVVDVLRDKRAVGGAALPLGSRRALDALIATHSVVMDATARVMWVSEGPHLAGRYLRFDVGRMLAEGYDPEADPPAPDVGAVPADPIAASGDYDAWVRRGAPHGGEKD